VSPLIARGRSLWRNVFARPEVERELDEELRAYVELLTQEKVRTGMPAAAARRAALIELGGMDNVKEEVRDVRIGALLESTLQDLRYALRSFAKTPGFTAIAIAALAIGIGATTAIFSVVDGVLLRSLPYPDADRIMQLWQVNANGNQAQVSDPNFQDWQAQSRSFSALAQVGNRGIVSIAGATEPTRVRAAVVSRDFFRVLGVQPVLGRAFLPEEQVEGGAPAVVVSYRFWQRYLGGRRDALGTALTYSNTPFTIVGVMSPVLNYPADVDLWVPRELEAPLPSRTAHNWQVIGRLRDGVTLAQARQDMSAISRALKQQLGDDTWMVDAAVIPLREQMVGRVRPALLILLGASAVLLLIACANVVSLLLARAASRQGELALRLALGAGRGRLARQFLVETSVLSLAGGALGVVLATIGVRALLALEPGNLPRAGEVGVSWTVLAFALGVALVSAVGMGLLTALRSTRGDLRDALAQAQRTQAGGSTSRVRSALVLGQVALTLVLLVGAGLLARSFLRLMEVDPGYRTERALVLDVALPYGSTEVARRDLTRFYEELFARLRTIPGVSEVGGVNGLPLSAGQTGDGTFLILSRPDEPLEMADLGRLLKDTARTGEAEFRVASSGYFRAMNIPLVRGRLFDDRDAPDAPHVAVISASLAKARWPNEDPLGKIIQFGNMDGDLRPFTIVGIVGDVRERSLAAEPRPTFYANYRQRPRTTATMNIVLTGSGDVAPVTATARRMVRDLRPDVPPRFRSIETVVADSVADRRFVLLLIAVFGGVALVLATLGVYGVISYLVAQRRQEIGIRVALGAQRSDVLRLVLRQGALLAVAGIVVGTAAALAATRLLEGLLYGVSATDPLSFVAVIAVLITVALVASWIPAQRATRVEPVSVMRA
jgi:predicted permease